MYDYLYMYIYNLYKKLYSISLKKLICKSFIKGFINNSFRLEVKTRCLESPLTITYKNLFLIE